MNTADDILAISRATLMEGIEHYSMALRYGNDMDITNARTLLNRAIYLHEKSVRIAFSKRMTNIAENF